MDGQSGLMAPIGTRARSEFEKEEKRRRQMAGWRGLVSTLAEPISWSPIPALSIGAGSAGALAEGGLVGLLSQWDTLIPQILRRGPKAMNVVAAPKDWLDRGTPTVVLPRSQKEVGVLASNHERIIDKALPQKDKEVVERTLKEFYYDPKVYDRAPDLADTKVTLRKVPDMTAEYPGESKGAFNPFTGEITIDYRTIEGPRGLKGVLSHELTHAIAKKTGLPQGTSPASYELYADDLYNKMLRMRDLGQTVPMELLEKFHNLKLYEDLALALGYSRPGTLMYHMTEGEALARMPQSMRRFSKSDHLAKNTPSLDVPEQYIVLNAQSLDNIKPDDMMNRMTALEILKRSIDKERVIRDLEYLLAQQQQLGR